MPISWFEKRLSATCAKTRDQTLFRERPGWPPYSSRAGSTKRSPTFNEGIAATKEMEIPTDWAYLALAYARTGNLAESAGGSTAWRSPTDASATFWDLQELSLLRSEAESLLFDAGFPRDPFGRPGPR